MRWPWAEKVLIRESVHSNEYKLVKLVWIMGRPYAKRWSALDDFEPLSSTGQDRQWRMTDSSEESLLRWLDKTKGGGTI